MKALINNIIPFSSVDGKGNRTAIFFQGCNLNCIYCHNKETINKCSKCFACVDNCTSNSLTIKNNDLIFDKVRCISCDKCINTCKNNSTPKTIEMSVSDIINIIKPYKNFIAGITVSGGECTLNERFLIELFKECKKINLTNFIDTNGTTDLSTMPELMSLTDGVMLDVKSWDNTIYQTYIGVGNDIVKKNLNYLLEIHKLEEVRTVVVDEIFDNETTILSVSKILSKFKSNALYKIIKVRVHSTNNTSFKSPSDEYLNYLAQITQKNCKNKILIT